MQEKREYLDVLKREEKDEDKVSFGVAAQASRHFEDTFCGHEEEVRSRIHIREIHQA
jgi:hypothetical protein